MTFAQCTAMNVCAAGRASASTSQARAVYKQYNAALGHHSPVDPAPLPPHFSEPLPRSTKRRRQGAQWIRSPWPGRRSLDVPSAGCAACTAALVPDGGTCHACDAYNTSSALIYVLSPLPAQRHDLSFSPSRSGNLLFSSPCLPFSLFASFAPDENRSIAFLSAVSLQRPFPS